jgi:hypothetical protein
MKSDVFERDEFLQNRVYAQTFFFPICNLNLYRKIASFFSVADETLISFFQWTSYLTAHLTQAGFNFTEMSGLTLELLRQLISTDLPVTDEVIIKCFSRCLSRTLTVGVEFLGCLTELLVYLLIVGFKLSILLFPHLIRLGQVVVEFHRTQLDMWDIVVEFAILITAILVLAFRQRIKDFWNRTEKQLASKYRIVAKFGPHVLFFVVALLLAIAGKKFLFPLANSLALPLVITVYPLYLTITRIRREDSIHYVDALKYWVIASLYFATNFVLGSIPFSGRVSQYISVVHVLVFIISIWIQVSSVCVDIVFDATEPVLRYYVDRIPAADIGSKYVGGIINALKMIRVLDDKKAAVIEGLLTDSISVIIATFCFFSTSFISSLGVFAVGMVLPAFRSSKLIRPTGALKEERSLLVNSQAFYLRYWCCFMSLLIVRTIGVALGPRLVLLISLWLQHTYFRGADKVFDFITTNAASVARRHNHKRSAIKNDTSSLQAVALGNDSGVSSEAKAPISVDAVTEIVEAKSGNSPESTTCNDHVDQDKTFPEEVNSVRQRVKQKK